MGELQSVYVGPVVSWGMWSAMVGGLELHATSCLNGAYTPWPQTLGVRGLAPWGSGPGHGGTRVLGCLLPVERNWAGRADRSSGIAKPTLTCSI